MILDTKGRDDVVVGGKRELERKGNALDTVQRTWLM